jgi:hypothetical protein
MSFSSFEKAFSDSNQLITGINVIDNDSSFHYQYYYDNYGHKVLETKFINQNNVWNRLSQHEWIYDKNLCLVENERIWKNNVWNLTYSISYSDSANLLVSELHQQYSNAMPIPVKKIDYQYHNSQLSTRNEYFVVATGWKLNQQTTYTYYPDAHLNVFVLSQFQNDTISNQYRNTFTYNIDGAIASQLVEINSSNSGWKNFQFTQWYYQAATKLLLTQRSKIWNDYNSLWENYQRIDNEYNGNGELIDEVYQYWKSMFWQDDIRYDYKYDNNGVEYKKILSFPIYHQWRPTISINYSDFVNSKANIIESNFEFWGGNTGELTTSYIPFDFNGSMVIQKAQQINVSYQPTNDSTFYLPQLLSNISDIPVYPNPSKGIYYLDAQKYNVKAWSITNLSGQILINHLVALQSGMIDISDLPKGVYLLKVKTEDQQYYYQKLIKE